MPYQFFTVPILASEAGTEALNKFLSTHKVIEISKEMVQQDGMAYWSFCVKYLEGAPPTERNLKYPQKIDYREILSEKEFEKFARYRAIRKQLATDNALPAYAIFTDAEMAEMAKVETITTASLLEINGIGKKKVEKYGQYFIQA